MGVRQQMVQPLGGRTSDGLGDRIAGLVIQVRKQSRDVALYTPPGRLSPEQICVRLEKGLHFRQSYSAALVGML